MPFMHGRGAIGRTLQYLQQGQIILNKNVRVVMFAFNEDAMGRKFPHHYGLRLVNMKINICIRMNNHFQDGHSDIRISV